jgi:hypothetical protein
MESWQIPRAKTPTNLRKYRRKKGKMKIWC